MSMCLSIRVNRWCKFVNRKKSDEFVSMDCIIEDTDQLVQVNSGSPRYGLDSE